MLTHITCPICNNKLSKPETIIAGIGPVCHKRVKFAERANSDELRTMASKREYPNTAIKNNRMLILKNKQEEVYSLVHVLQTKKEEFICIDLNNVRKEYNNERDIVKAYVNSINVKKQDDFEYVSDVNQPDSPDFRKKFNNFNEEYKNELTTQNYVDKTFQELSLTNYYVKINMKEDMTSLQLKNRDEMSILRENNTGIYNQMWTNGLFQRATLIQRMKLLKNKEAVSFTTFLESNHNFSDLKTKDWGLTDDEIVNGLKHSTQKIESYLFLAYLNGNKNFGLMLTLSQKIPEMSKENRFKAYQAVIKMLGNQNFNKDDLKKEFK